MTLLSYLLIAFNSKSKSLAQTLKVESETIGKVKNLPETFGLLTNKIVINTKTRIENDLIDTVESGSSEIMLFGQCGKRCSQGVISYGENNIVSRNIIFKR